MALVPGSLQIDIFVTNIPKDSKSPPPPPPKSDSQSGSKPYQYSGTPTKYPPTSNAPRLSLPAASMEDVPLSAKPPISIYLVPPEEDPRRHRSGISISDDYNTLLIPTPRLELDDGPYGGGGLNGKGYGYEAVGGGSHSQEDSTYDVLDYTHFNGDLDAEVAPAEELLSRRLRQEGAARRRKTRKRAMGYSESQNNSWVDLGQQVASPTTGGVREHSPPLHGHGRSYSQSLSLDVSDATLTGKQSRRVSAPGYLPQNELGQLDLLKSRMERPSLASLRGSVLDVSTVQSMMPKTGKGARGEEMEIQFREEELEDVLAMAEYAWPGRPMLDKLLREEVEVAKGPIVVACECFYLSLSLVAPRSSDSDSRPPSVFTGCGPTSLSASIRKIVAAQIDPHKIKTGDLTGHISCITEEFEY